MTLHIPIDSCTVINKQTPTEKGTLDINGMHSSIFNILIYVIIPLDSCAVINEQTPTEKGTLLVLDSNGMHSSTFEYSDICYNIHLDSCAVINEQTPTEKETQISTI